jgi:hypothetical protein
VITARGNEFRRGSHIDRAYRGRRFVVADVLIVRADDPTQTELAVIPYAPAAHVAVRQNGTGETATTCRELEGGAAQVDAGDRRWELIVAQVELVTQANLVS